MGQKTGWEGRPTGRLTVCLTVGRTSTAWFVQSPQFMACLELASMCTFPIASSLVNSGRACAWIDERWGGPRPMSCWACEGWGRKGSSSPSEAGRGGTA